MLEIQFRVTGINYILKHKQKTVLRLFEILIVFTIYNNNNFCVFLIKLVSFFVITHHKTIRL